MEKLVEAISSVKSTWTMAAFAIAALLYLVKLLLPASRAGNLRSRDTRALLILAVSLGVLALAPIVASTYLSLHRMGVDAIYRVHVLVLDSNGHPVTGAALRTTAANRTTTGSDGTGEIAIPRGSLAEDGRITIYADREAAFEHGKVDVKLANDPNVSTTITLVRDRGATVSGIVQDDRGHTVAGARVSILGGETGATRADGTFTLKAGAAEGQMVRLHVERAGFSSTDQDHPAGSEPATIIIIRDKGSPR